MRKNLIFKDCNTPWIQLDLFVLADGFTGKQFSCIIRRIVNMLEVMGIIEQIQDRVSLLIDSLLCNYRVRCSYRDFLWLLQTDLIKEFGKRRIRTASSKSVARYMACPFPYWLTETAL